MVGAPNHKDWSERLGELEEGSLLKPRQMGA